MYGSLEASVSADESNKPEGEGHGPPSSVFLRAMAAVTAWATAPSPSLPGRPLPTAPFPYAFYP